MLAADGLEYILAEGPAKGMKGYFAADSSGNITGVQLGGRLATRVASQ
jgi:hypothetical protein